MFETIFAFIVYYYLIGLVVNTFTALYLMNEARKEGMEIGVDWVSWLGIAWTWPALLYRIINGVFR